MIRTRTGSRFRSMKPSSISSVPSSRSGKSALQVATQVALEAGDILLERFSGKKQIDYKAGRANIVTDVDMLVDKHVIGTLRSEYPEFGIVSEESEAIAGDAPFTWIVDPLDGTNNYAFGIPCFCVNVALAQGEEVLLGLTHDPMRKETFRAEKGAGAFLNDRAICVSQKQLVSAAFIGCDMGYDADRGRQVLDVIMSLWPNIHGLRILGSAALGLAYAACGRLDLYLQPQLFPWDVAAGILLVSESGGKVTDWAGKPAGVQSQRVIAGNDLLRDEFSRLVHEAGTPLASFV